MIIDKLTVLLTCLQQMCHRDQGKFLWTATCLLVHREIATFSFPALCTVSTIIIIKVIKAASEVVSVS